MRAAPAPRLREARTAALQPSNAAPSSGVLTRGAGAGRGSASGSAFKRAYEDWQGDAKAAARTIGVARFTANMFAATAARVTLVIEERSLDGRTWAPTEDPELVGIMDDYRNDVLGQGPAELLRFHAWHYQVAGEGLLVTRDGAAGYAEWFVFSTRVAEWDKPTKGQVIFALTPGGSIKTGEAFAVDRRMAVRYWMPDEEFGALPVSPMTSAMDDLRRWQDLTRYAHRVARNYLAMNGMLWTPKKAHETEDDDDDAALDDEFTEAMAEVAKRDTLVDLYQQISRTSIAEDDRLESVVPPMVWWGEAGDEPKWVQVGRGLDEQGIAHRREALLDWARGVDAPGSMIEAGGGATGNHWNEWLNEERFHGTVAPLLNRMTHQDLTAAYLTPRLRLLGRDAGRYRVGYDATDVIVHPDKSDAALRAWLAGLLKPEVALTHLGFAAEDLATPEDLDRLAKILGKFATGGAPPAPGTVTTPPGGDAPVGPATTTEAPPEPPAAPGAVTLPTPQAALAPFLPGDTPTPSGFGAQDLAVALVASAITDADGAGAGGAPPTGAEASPAATSGDAPAGSLRTAASTSTAPLNPVRRSRPRTEGGKKARAQVREYRRLLDRLARARRDTAQRLLAGAEVALAEALRLAGVRAVSKARNKSRTTAAAISEAWKARQPIGSHLAALGMTEDQLLSGAFTSYEEQAAEWLRALREQERSAIQAAGFDPDVAVPGPESGNDPDLAAAGFLSAALLALARQRIMQGGDPTSLAVPGEVSGTVPAQLAAQALRVAQGTATVQRATSPDVLPTVHSFPTGRAAVQDYLTAEIRDRLAATLRDEATITDDPEARARLEDAIAEASTTTTEYVWTWGFYGQPSRPFEPHERLDGYITVDPEGDPNLYNDEGWPEGNLYQPGDHLGCTCEWVALLPESVDTAVADATE